MAEVTNVMEPGAIKRVTFESTRGVRYAELFFVGPELIFIYSSVGWDQAPPELWDTTEADEVAKQYGAATVIKNGPHWWAADTTTLDFAVDDLTVSGIVYRFAAKIPAFLAAEGKLEPPSYTVVEANKSGELVYSAGQPVYELVSPDGDVL